MTSKTTDSTKYRKESDFEMEKGLVALLLLCYVGHLVPDSSAEPGWQGEISLQELENEFLDEEEQPPPFAKPQQANTGGGVYTRWGSASCPSTSTLVYSGRAGGSFYSHTGSGSNYLCLPDDPEYYSGGTPTSYPAFIYASEYEVWATELQSAIINQNVPCAVCSTPQKLVLMVPAKITCPTGWTREYNGFLMASYWIAQAKTFVCVDQNTEVVPGEAADHDGAAFYRSRLGGTNDCFGLDCPPYNVEQDLSCVVCTK